MSFSETVTPQTLIDVIAKPKLAEVLRNDASALGLVAIALACTQPDSPQVYLSSRKEYQPAGAAWKEMGVDAGSISDLLDESGAWKLEISHTFEELLYSLQQDTWEEFRDRWTPFFEKVYAPVQTYLDRTAYTEFGFNDHRFQIHIQALFNMAYAFAQNTDISWNRLENNQFLMSVMLHDAGNAFNRSAHSAISVNVARMLFGEQVLDHELTRPALEAIMVHDEKMVGPVNHALINELAMFDGSAEEQNRAFMDVYGATHTKIASMLRLLDKANVGPERILNTVGPRDGAFTADAHLLINAVFRLNLDKFGMDPQNPRRFVTQFDFGMTPADDFNIPKNAPIFVKKERPRTDEEVEGRVEYKLPSDYRRGFKENGLNYFTKLSRKLVEIYSERFKIIALDVLNVLENCDEVAIRITDPESGRVRTKQHEYITNEPIEFVFRRASILQDIAEFEAFVASLTVES